MRLGGGRTMVKSLLANDYFKAKYRDWLSQVHRSSYWVKAQVAFTHLLVPHPFLFCNFSPNPL